VVHCFVSYHVESWKRHFLKLATQQTQSTLAFRSFWVVNIARRWKFFARCVGRHLLSPRFTYLTIDHSFQMVANRRVNKAWQRYAREEPEVLEDHLDNEYPWISVLSALQRSFYFLFFTLHRFISVRRCGISFRNVPSIRRFY